MSFRRGLPRMPAFTGKSIELMCVCVCVDGGAGGQLCGAGLLCTFSVEVRDVTTRTP